MTPTRRRCRRCPTRSRRATPTRASTRSASPRTGSRSPAAAGLDTDRLPQIEFGFLLHDVGKVGVPDAILFKPGALSEDEFALIAQHPVIGSEILRDVDFLGEGKLVVRHHHERWDGTGYPDRLAGDDIPLPARVFAVADALDALTTDRPTAAAPVSRAPATRSASTPAASSTPT